MDREQLERELAERLTDGQLTDEERAKRVKAKLSPKYEVRIQAELEPVVEETIRYRQLAKELDERYDRFVKPE